MMRANNPKGASSEAEILKRCDDIMGLVVDGMPFRAIRQYASEACPWHVSDITLRRYIGRCTAGFWEHSQAEITQVRGQAALRRLRTIDATCPLVTKVHREAIRFAGQGYTVILIGHAGHDEVIGTMGEAAESILLVGRAEDVERIDVPDPHKVVYLTQTTLSVADAAEIVQRLRQRFPEIVGPPKDDICYATQNRQEAIRALSRAAELVLVVGSRNSSNSQRLTEIARANGVPSRLIDGPADMDPAWFAGMETVVVTAGASAPEDLVTGCVRWLEERFPTTVESAAVCREEIRFSLPRELRTG